MIESAQRISRTLSLHVMDCVRPQMKGLRSILLVDTGAGPCGLRECEDLQSLGVHYV